MGVYRILKRGVYPSRPPKRCFAGGRGSGQNVTLKYPKKDQLLEMGGGGADPLNQMYTPMDEHNATRK